MTIIIDLLAIDMETGEYWLDFEQRNAEAIAEMKARIRAKHRMRYLIGLQIQQEHNEVVKMTKRLNEIVSLKRVSLGRVSLKRISKNKSSVKSGLPQKAPNTDAPSSQLPSMGDIIKK
jgi:hypothetical protein